MRTVMCFGTFDNLHAGHISYLKQAKKHGDNLVVVVARDETVKQIKGRAPKHNMYERVKALNKIDFVHMAILGHVHDKLEVIIEIKPDVLCLGYDQNSFTAGLKQKLNARGFNPEIIRLKPHKPHKYKSSKLNKSI